MGGALLLVPPKSGGAMLLGVNMSAASLYITASTLRARAISIPVSLPSAQI